MLVDYAVIEISCFEYYLDATSLAKYMRVNCITNFLVHISKCITFRQFFFVTATLLAKSSLKSFYSRLGFKVNKDFATSPNSEEACKRFNY